MFWFEAKQVARIVAGFDRGEATVPRICEGAQYANGWLFISAAGSPFLALERVLTKVAEEWDGEFLEFEGTPTEVSAFWEEWGGRYVANRIYGYLQALAAV